MIEFKKGDEVFVFNHEHSPATIEHIDEYKRVLVYWKKEQRTSLVRFNIDDLTYVVPENIRNSRLYKALSEEE